MATTAELLSQVSKQSTGELLKQAQPKRPETDPISAIIQRFGEGITFGGTRKIVPQIQGRIAAIGPKTTEETIPRAKQEFEARRTALRKDFPTIGSIAELATFFTPGGAPRAIPKLIAKGAGKIIPKAAPRIARALAKPVISAAEAGTSSGIVEGAKGVVEGDGLERGIGAAKTGLLVGGALGTVTSAASSILGPAFKKIGTKIQTSLLKPKDKVIREGFKIENVFKHGLEGDLQQGLTKAENRLNVLGSELKNQLAGSKARIDLVDVLSKTEGKFQKEIARGFGKNKAIQKAVGDFMAEIEIMAPDGQVNLLSANQIKQAVGKMGAWNVLQPDVNILAKKKVANAFYSSLREAIENAGDTETIKLLNREMSEIIPVQRAIISRIPVAAKNDLFSLTDAVTSAAAIASGPKGWTLAILNKLSKSPAGAKLFRTGERLQRFEPIGPKTLQGLTGVRAILEGGQ